jgi:hypothetical protein
MTRSAIPALCKGHDRDSVARGTSKGQMFGKRYQAQLKYNNSIRRQGLKQRLHLGSRRALNKTFRQIVELDIAKQTVRTCIRLQKMSVRSLWRGQPPPKRKKRLDTE